MPVIVYFNGAFLFPLGTLDKLHHLILKLPGPFMQHFTIKQVSQSSSEQTMVSSRPKCNSYELNKCKLL